MVLGIFNSLLNAQKYANNPLYAAPVVPNNLAQVRPNQPPFVTEWPDPHTQIAAGLNAQITLGGFYDPDDNPHFFNT